MTDQIDTTPVQTPAATDIRMRCWFDRFLPRFAQEWARLGRWDRPVGVWLLYWPCVWGLMLAPGFAALHYQQQFTLLGLFLLGAFAMRGAGCTINDLWDRKLDARVARTAQRPLAAGRIGVFSALVFLALQCAVGLWVLWHLRPIAQITALGYIPLIILYPLMKRITMWPQAFLSVVFSAGALIGWLSVSPLGVMTVILYAITMAWVLAYDTIYAHLDKHDDEMVGIKSTVINLGERAVDLVVVCWWFVLIGWGFIGAMYDMPVASWVMLGLSAGLQLLRCGLWDADNDRQTLDYFRSQAWFGGAWALACWYHVLQFMPSGG